jgi:hypothetical protein
MSQDNHNRPVIAASRIRLVAPGNDAASALSNVATREWHQASHADVLGDNYPMRELARKVARELRTIRRAAFSTFWARHDLPVCCGIIYVTKVLAIGSVTAKGTPDAIAPVMPFEVGATVRNYLAGKIDQWFFQADG